MRCFGLLGLMAWSVIVSAQEPAGKATEKAVCYPNVERDPPSPMSALEKDKIRKLSSYLVSRAEEVSFDYSDDSIKWLDARLTKNGQKMREKDSAQSAILFGSYLGETIAHRYQGEWVLVGHEPAVLVNDRVLLFPMGQVLNHIQHGEQCSIYEYFVELTRLLVKKSPAAISPPASTDSIETSPTP